MFDCVRPTRLARHGTAMTEMDGSSFAMRPTPRISVPCPRYVCRNYSRVPEALAQGQEILGLRLVTWHNLAFLLELMNAIRCSAGRKVASLASFLAKYYGNTKGGSRRT